MIISFGHFILWGTYQLAMVAHKDKQCIVKPGLFLGFGHKLTDRPVGIFYYLVFYLFTFGVEIVRNDVGRMIADREQYG